MLGLSPQMALCADSVAGFPAKVAAEQEIDAVVARHGLSDQARIQRVEIDDEVRFAVVFVESGFGISCVENYVYICMKGKCMLVAYRKTRGAGATAVWDANELELVVSDETGSLLHRLRFPELKARQPTDAD